MMMGMALYDTCTDGMALDTTPTEEEGIIQGFMVGGRAAGMVVSSAALGMLVQNFSWRPGLFFWRNHSAAAAIGPEVKEAERPPENRFEWGAFGAFRTTASNSAGITWRALFARLSMAQTNWLTLSWSAI